MDHLVLVSPRQRHLKWTGFDKLEAAVMILCGVAIAGFTLTVFFDVTSRTIGRPWLWLQEVTTHFFVYGIFLGTAAATRRNDHLYLSAVVESFSGGMRVFFEVFTRIAVLAVAVCLVVFGHENFLHGFGSVRMPSLTPEASLTFAIPLCGLLVGLFTIEQLVNGLRNGFPAPVPEEEDPAAGRVP